MYQVASTIRAALSINTAERQAAEALLSSWEADAAPGFVISLIRIVEEYGAIDEVGGRSRAWVQGVCS